MTPAVEWLEEQEIDTIYDEDYMGRVLNGGFTVFGHLKYDDCMCNGDSHRGIMGMCVSYVYPLDPRDCCVQLDPYDVAVKRGAPA